MTQSSKTPRFVTPVGTLGYSHLRQLDPHPEYGGKWKAKLILSEQDAESLLAKLRPMMEELEARPDVREKVAASAKAKKPTFQINELTREVFDRDTKEPIPGMVEMSFERKPEGKDKNKKVFQIAPPRIVDSRNKDLPQDVIVRGGSKVRIDFSVSPYVTPKSAGLKLRLNGVQVYKLAEGGGGTMFDELDDGYVVDDDTTTAFTASGSTAADDVDVDF